MKSINVFFLSIKHFFLARWQRRTQLSMKTKKSTVIWHAQCERARKMYLNIYNSCLFEYRSLLKDVYKENALVLTTPKRNELLKEGPPEAGLNRCHILGRGAYGTVFKAIYRGKCGEGESSIMFIPLYTSLLPLEHSVALKVIKNSAISTLHNEAHVLDWKHKNIVRLIKLESTPEFGLLIMERPNGLCLQRVLDTLALPLIHRVL